MPQRHMVLCNITDTFSDHTQTTYFKIYDLLLVL